MKTPFCPLLRVSFLTFTIGSFFGFGLGSDAFGDDNFVVVTNKYFLSKRAASPENEQTNTIAEVIANIHTKAEVTKPVASATLNTYYKIYRSEENKLTSVESAPLLAALNTFRIEDSPNDSVTKDHPSNITKENSDFSARLASLIKRHTPPNKEAVAVLEGGYFNVYPVEKDTKSGTKTGSYPEAIDYKALFGREDSVQSYVKLNQIKSLNGQEYILVKHQGLAIELSELKQLNPEEKKCLDQQYSDLAKIMEAHLSFSQLLISKLAVKKIETRLMVESQESHNAPIHTLRKEPLKKSAHITDDSLVLTATYNRATGQCDLFSPSQLHHGFTKLVENYNQK